MNDIGKAINELQFQLNSKEVKEQHYPVQLSASDVEKILSLLKEQNGCENCAIAIEDRQPVVRCKDCKHKGQTIHQKDGTNIIVCWNQGYGIHHPIDWFCADGERK